MTVRLGIWGRGQSNRWGVNPGEGYVNVGTPGTYSNVKYWDTLFGTSDCNAFRDLDGAHGVDRSLGRVLYEAGYRVTIVNTSKGSTYSNDWIPPQTLYTDYIAEVTQAWAALQALYPGDSWIHVDHVDIGEEDIRYPVQAIPLLWAENNEVTHAGLEGVLGVRALRLVTQTNSDLVGRTYPFTVEDEQRAFAGSSSRVVNRNSSNGITYADVNGLHCNTAGYIEVGKRDAATLIQSVYPMGTLSSFSRNTLNDHFRNKATYSPAATHYAAALIAGVEVTGNGYARASNTNNTTTWPNAAARTKSSGAAFNFPAASGGDWGTIDEIRIYDASSGGNELGRHTLSSTVTVTNGGSPLTVASGAITITAASGAFVDAVAHSALNLMFGATAWTQLTATFGSYWAGDPQGAGAQAGNRFSITSAATWNNSSSGISTTVADITITDQATGTYWAEHDASTLGNLLCSAILPATPTGGRVVAGRLKSTLT